MTAAKDEPEMMRSLQAARRAKVRQGRKQWARLAVSDGDENLAGKLAPARRRPRAGRS